MHFGFFFVKLGSRVFHAKEYNQESKSLVLLMIRTISFFFLFLAFTVLSVGKSQSQDANTSYTNDQVNFNFGLKAYKKRDYQTALKEWMPLASKGNVLAQYNLAMMHRLGLGVPKDLTEAVKWYQLAAANGDVRSQYTLGTLYQFPKHGLISDYKKAISFYRSAAKQGHSNAQRNLGIMYWKGLGITKNLISAYVWTNMAILTATGSYKNSELAMDNLMALKELMSPSDLDKANKLAEKCASLDFKGC
ncbi:MAG: tetratricopeptide repeat protein [Rhodospirillaceae bacterium]